MVQSLTCFVCILATAPTVQGQSTDPLPFPSDDGATIGTNTALRAEPTPKAEPAQPLTPVRDNRIGTSTEGLVGLHRVAAPLGSPWMFNGTAAVGYGFTESVLETNDTHHRGFARLALGFQPFDHFAAALRLDGRLDVHMDDEGTDDGIVGEPRLIFKGWHNVDWFDFGAQLTVLFPGQDAPDFRPDATSGELMALLGARLDKKIRTYLNVGFRLDNVSNATPDPATLTDLDRTALGVADSHAVLAGLGGSYRFEWFEVFAEFTYDYLVENDLGRVSPLRVGAGGRMWSGRDRQWQTQLRAEFVASPRPNVADPSEPLAPIEPRFSIEGSISFRFPPAPAERERFDENFDVKLPEVDKQPERKASPHGEVVTTVLDPYGRAVSDAQVSLLREGEVVKGPVVAGPAGKVRFDKLEPAPNWVVSVQADRFKTVRRTVAVERGRVASENVTLSFKLPQGQIRGTVQSFNGQPLAATVRVEPLGQEVKMDATGRFELEVPPGKYTIIFSLPGYQEQRRPISVQEEGVTIIQVDMRRDRTSGTRRSF